MKKYIKILIVFLITITISVNSVIAKNNNLIQSGEKVTIDEKLEGTAFILGEKVTLNDSIDGIGFIAGNELYINENQNYIFGLSTKVNIKKDIEKDLFLLSSMVNINSNIKRDAYIAGEEININGNIERNTYIYGTEVKLSGTYKGNVIINSAKITIAKDTKILGTLKYNKNAIIEGINESIKIKTYELKQTLTLKEYILNFITSYIHITLLGITLIFIYEKIFKKSLNQIKELNIKNIAIVCGKGFLILLGVPIIAIMLITSGLFISVGLIGALVYGILIYISNIFTGYIIASILDKKLKKNMNGYLLVIIGLFIVYVINNIPIVGSFSSLLFTIFGLGITGNMIIELKK